MSGGTGRRRKPPVGEEGNEQYAPPQPPAEPYPQYQTYQAYEQPAPESYDYDWRQPQQPQPDAPQPYEAPTYQTRAYEAPVQEPPAPPAYQPPQFPGQPQAPVYEQYTRQPYAQPATPAVPAPSSADYFGSGSYEIPLQTPAAPTRARPEPRPEPAPAPPAPAPVAAPAPAAPAPFEFEFDPDDETGGGTDTGTAEAPSAAQPVTGNRPADKDGYRPGDFSFVDEADDPTDVKGWLNFSESRADTRAERLRKLRARLIALVIVLALIAAGVGVYVWLGGSVPGLTSTAPTNSMILFRLDDAKGDAVGDALLTTDGSVSTDGSKVTGSGSIVVIPSQLQINSDGFGSQTFGGSMADDQPPAGADDVDSTFGVTPTGTRDMDETTFGILVDELGGISLTTTTSVPASTADPKGVSQGAVTLTGVQAVAYATYSASGESATAQATRFSQVLNALVAKLPTEASAVQAYLKQLGLIPDATLPLAELSQILATLAAQQNAGKVTVATLPLTSKDALDTGGASSIVSKLLGGTVKASATAS